MMKFTRLQSLSMMRLLTFICLIFGFSLLSVGQPREIKIQIAATADVHARLFSYDFVSNQPASTSMANVHTVAQMLRSRNGNNLILLDNGDLIQGTPAAYYANFVQDEKHNLFSRVMNFMKFDAATIGNHDIEAGPEVYNRLKDEFDFPWLGANVLDQETGEPYFVPYTIIERQRVRIAILGLTTTGVPNWLPTHLWEGLAFQDMVESARYWMEYIREHEDADAIVGLFHAGMGPLDPDPSAHPLDNASGYIAKNIPGFDVIFLGHDHRRRIQTVVNVNGDEVLLLGPGHHTENLALAELTFTVTARRSFELKNVRGDMIPTERAVPSHLYVQAFEKDVEEILAFANEPVGRITEPMHSLDALFGSAPFTDLVHEIQLSITGADISFTAPLAFDETVRAGTLRWRDFFKLYEYENYLYTMELTGREIMDYLEFSYDLWFNQMQDEHDNLLHMHRDALGRVPSDRRGRQALRNPAFNFDSAAGIRYTVDVSKGAGERIQIRGMEDGSPFDPDVTYKVAINSYRGSGGGGHLTQGAGIPHEKLGERILHTTNTDLRTKMVEYFREVGTFIPEKRNNWQLIPEEWAEQGRINDMPYLRP